MKKQNFTLAELIVSAIPLLAMALMLPALYAKSVTETTVTACMNNQKQISIALYAYAPAYGGHAPYVDYELGEGGSNATRVTWASALSSGQFLKDNASYFCPAAAPLFKGTLGEQRSRMNGTETCISQPQKYLERYRFINYGINHEYIAGNFGNWHSGNAKEHQKSCRQNHGGGCLEWRGNKQFRQTPDQRKYRLQPFQPDQSLSRGQCGNPLERRTCDLAGKTERDHPERRRSNNPPLFQHDKRRMTPC